jgi:hypothetical protein
MSEISDTYKRYMRYMVFEWSEYDNVAPFECCRNSFDNLEEAKSYLNSIDDEGKCIFDRVEGIFIFYQAPD